MDDDKGSEQPGNDKRVSLLPFMTYLGRVQYENGGWWVEGRKASACIASVVQILPCLKLSSCDVSTVGKPETRRR